MNPSYFTFNARITARSKVNKIETRNGKIIIKVTAAAADGQANRAVIRLVSENLSVPSRSVEIISGLYSRNKIIKVDNMNSENFFRLLNL